MLIGANRSVGRGARNFLGVLAATTGMAFFMISLTFHEDDSRESGLDLLIELFPLFIPMALQFTVPVSALVAVVLVVREACSRRAN